MSYKIGIEILDEDEETVLNPLDYEDLGECVDKYLRLTVSLKRA
jgi:hypothetical protein